jgi:ABC-type polysaccharide/polyol phosphate export permease
MGLFLSAANLFLRDVKYLVEVVVTFAIFFTPVFYDTNMFGASGRLLLLNPLAPVLEALSDTVVHARSPEVLWVAYSAAIALSGLLLGWTFFKKVEPLFAERV